MLLAAEALTAGIVASWTWVRLVKPSTSCRARWLAGDSGRLAKVVEVRWAGAPGGSAAAAALQARLLVEKRGERDREGQLQTVYALGEAAMGPDGQCAGIDEFITAMFVTADPAQASEGM